MCALKNQAWAAWLAVCLAEKQGGRKNLNIELICC